MKNRMTCLVTFVFASGPGGLIANAHESVVDHAHPHASAFDNALLGLDALALIALGLIGVAIAGLLLVRRRR